MKLRSVFRVPLILVSAAVASWAAPDESVIQARVAALMARMTQEEKIGQLIQYSQPGAETGPAVRSNFEAEIRAGRCGSMLNLTGAAATRATQRLAIEETRLGIPLLFALDVVHGYRTMFPINLGQAASWDLAAIERSERIAATEAAAAGVHWTFAPMVDIARDPRWGRISEGSGEDPLLGSAIARARVRGFQGDDLSRVDTILACAKHFAAYGAAEAGRDYNTVDLSELRLRDIYLPPFRAAVEAGVATFMAAFNDLNGVPCTANRFLLTDVLRGEWNFNGFVVSDWNSLRELIAHGFAANAAEACRLAMNAGLDMDMENRIYGRQLATQIESGAVPQARLDAAVAAVLAAKFRLGLFDDPYRYCDPEREQSTLLRPEFITAARDLVRKSCVLLKNDDAILPLRPDARIALIGELATARRDLIATWEARGRVEDVVTLRDALDTAFPGKIVFAEGAKTTGSDRSGFAAAIEAARNADVIVAALGEHWQMSGEAGSRARLDLPGVQMELLTELRRTGKPIVLVLFTGRPLVLAPVLEQVDALLVAWFPGTMGGPGITDLLSGAFSPSGKLPATFPRTVGQVPLHYSHKSTGRPIEPNAPDERFRSRYVDVPNTPEFPFGFGLSYTTFEYREPRVTSVVLSPGGEQRISVTVVNTGARPGAEVVQLYVRDLVGSLTRPVRELKAFERIELAPGESREVTFTLKPSDLAFHHADSSFAPEPGQFEVFVGGDSTAPKIGAFEYRE